MLAASLRIGVLGPLTVDRGSVGVDGMPTKQRCLLGFLALRPNQAVGRDEIAAALWGEELPATWLNMVQAYVAALRKAIEPQWPRRTAEQVIATVGGGYRLQANAESLDLLRFDELVRQARTARPEDAETALACLIDALRCWRAPVLADLPDRLRQHPAAVDLAASAECGAGLRRPCLRMRSLWAGIGSPADADP